MRMRKKKNGEARLLACREVILDLPQSPMADPASVMGKNGGSVFLEIGAGKGGFACEMAKRNPNAAYFAMEKVSDCVVIAAEKAISESAERDVTICDDETIHAITKEHRGIDRPTDVLSFPFYDFDNPEVMTLLGDIIISYDTAYRQAEEYGHSPKREFCFLSAHSALHLLGYDHETDDEREVMESKQREILDKLGIKR